MAAVILLLAGSGTAFAQVTFSQPTGFTVEQPCTAYTSLRNKTYPVPLEIGVTYTALAENRQPNPTHVLLRLGSENKWAELSCGHYASGTLNTPLAPPADNTAQCLPFFDNENNPVAVKFGGTVDITPPAPALNAFDQAIDATCGPAGKVVSREEFKTLMRNHPDVLARIKAFTHNSVFANRPQTSSEDYLQDLTDAWFNIHAFDHIMCGEPGADGKIGGLHFHGRYLQLQQTGEACRMNNYRQNEVVPGVLYTMGVAMKGADGKIYRHATKGYGLTMNAEDILKAATRAFAENPTSSRDSTACMLPMADDGKTFTAVFVRRINGIRTFYPDGTPAPNDPRCVQPVNLQE